jgi:hypothetical protein
MTALGNLIERSPGLKEPFRPVFKNAPKSLDDAHKPDSLLRLSEQLLIDLLLDLRWVVFRRQWLGFTAAKLAQEILFRFECPANELTLMTMIANLVRTAMTAIAVDDSRVCIHQTTEDEENPNHEQKLPGDNTKLLHVKTLMNERNSLPNQPSIRAGLGLNMAPF